MLIWPKRFSELSATLAMPTRNSATDNLRNLETVGTLTSVVR